MINFDFLEKGLEIVSPPHFVYDRLGHFVLRVTSSDICQYVYCNCSLTRL